MLPLILLTLLGIVAAVVAAVVILVTSSGSGTETVAPPANAAWANEVFVQGDSQTAIQEYDQAITLDPNNAALLTSRGDVHRTIGADAAALDDYNRAITLDPTHKVALNNRGLLYTQTSQFDLTLADYDTSIDLNPTNARLYFNRGNVQVAIGTDASRTTAPADFQKAQELSDDNAMRELAQQRITDIQRRLNCIHSASRNQSSQQRNRYAAAVLRPRPSGWSPRPPSKRNVVRMAHPAPCRHSTA